MTAPRVPVTVVTGFLGSGKTTLLNRILTERHGLKIAVVENEFGAIGIDQDLLRGADDDLIELNDGCVCCATRGDLVRALGKLAARPVPLDRVVIETTGLADPAPVVEAFLADPALATAFRLDAILTVVDAAHVFTQLDRSPEARRQIAFADRVLLNKADLVSEDALVAAEKAVRAACPAAPILRTIRCAAPLEELLAVDAFDAARALELGFDARHDDAVEAVALSEESPLDLDKLDAWLGGLLRERSADLWRIKGILDVRGRDLPMVVQAVHALLEATDGMPWGARPRGSKLVFLGRDLGEAALRDGFRACRAD